MPTSNPSLNRGTFAAAARSAGASGGVMTLRGATEKTMVLSGMMLFSCLVGWGQAVANPAAASGWVMVGGLGGLIMALMISARPTTAPWAAPAYALLQGLLVGSVSALFAAVFDGIVLQAALLTTGTLVAMLLGYWFGVIQVTERFKSGVVAATGGICVLYLVVMVANVFGAGLTFLHDSSPLSIGFSLIVLCVAALNLAVDFDFIEQNARAGAPAYMEWYAGFALLVTLVWVYMEFLKLLSKLQSSSRDS